MRYNYIAIEGTIGAGKTSLVEKIASDFEARAVYEQFEENSFLPKFYKDPDKYAFPLEMSFMASRFQQLKTELSKGDMFRSFVVADYFLDKSLIFARKTLQEDEFSLFSRFFHFINTGLAKPELIIYLYKDVELLRQNIRKRGRVYEQDITAGYLEKIQSGYLSYFRQNDHLRVVIADTNDFDFIERSQDYQYLKEIIAADYPKGITTIPQ